MLAVVCVIVATLLLAKIARLAVNQRVLKSQGDKADKTEAYGFAAQLLVWFIGLELALHLLGVQLTSLFATGGALAISGGLAAKGFVEDFMSSWALKTGNAVRPGDVIVLNGRWLHVDRVGVRYITAKTADGEDILIPCSDMTKSVIENLTRDDRMHRIHAEVGVAYDSDLTLVRTTLEDVVRNIDWRIEDKLETVRLLDFARTDIVYSVVVWIDDVHQTAARESDLREAIWRGLTDAGVTVA